MKAARTLLWIICASIWLAPVAVIQLAYAATSSPASASIPIGRKALAPPGPTLAAIAVPAIAEKPTELLIDTPLLVTEQLVQALQSRLADLYAQRLRDDGGLIEGELALLITVERAGQVTRVELERSTLNDLAFESDIVLSALELKVQPIDAIRTMLRIPVRFESS